jgi:hypothetical protein
LKRYSSLSTGDNFRSTLFTSVVILLTTEAVKTLRFLGAVFILDIDGDIFFDVDRVRNRDGFRDVNRVQLRDMHCVRNRNWDFEGNLHRERDVFLDGVWHLSFYVNRVRLFKVNRNRLLHLNFHRHLDRIGYILLDSYRVGLRNRDPNFLSKDNGLHILVRAAECS